MGEMTDLLTEVTTLIGRLKGKYPTEINAFMNFMEKAQGGSALTTRGRNWSTSESPWPRNANGAFAVHVNHAIAAGATREELAEAAAVLMHEAPALMYLVPLFKALDEFPPQQD